MPEFVKTPKDEARWKKAKEAAAKSTDVGSDSYWKLANYIFHKNEDGENSEELAKSISTKVPNTSIPNPSKVGNTSVRMPKASKMPDPFGKKSLFFKSEMADFDGIKHPTLMKLFDFIQKKHKTNKIK